MRKLAVGIAAAGAVFALSTAASAQALGEEATFALSADHLFGVTSYNVTVDPDGGPDLDLSGTTTSLGYGASTRTGQYGVEVPLPSTLPRFSFDYFVIESLSLGGSLGYFASSGEWELGDADGDFDDVTAIALSPRVGYVLGLSDTIWCWLRGGFTWMSLDIDDTGEADVMQLDAEAMFAFGLVDHFAIEFGPHLGIPVSGSFDPDGNADEVDVSAMTFGVYAGLVGWL